MSENIHIGSIESSPAGKVGEVVYFIGIGGIGMSALARYYHSLGKK